MWRRGMRRKGDAAKERRGRDRPVPEAAGAPCKAANESLLWRASTDRTSGMPCSGKSRSKWRTTRHGRCSPRRWRAGDRASAGPESGNARSRAPKAARRSVRSPDASSGWSKKTQAAGIGATAGNGDAMEESMCRHGGLTAAVTTGFSKDGLTQIKKLQGAERVAASELHGSKLTWTPTNDERNDIAELTPCSGRLATMSVRPKRGGKYNPRVEIHSAFCP